MEINRRLQLVVPVDDESTGLTNYIIAQPIDRIVFERYARLIARTFTDILNLGIQTSGPRISLTLLRDNARSMNIADDAENGLINEIRRLANLHVPTADGWKLIPLSDAESAQTLSVDDIAEVENALAFFTVGWCMFNQRDRGPMLTAAMILWDGRIISSNTTEYLNSLKISTPEDNTGAKETPSSIPH